MSRILGREASEAYMAWAKPTLTPEEVNGAGAILINKAAARGALHRNAAARKKAQADRLVAGSRS